jgi:hypothetical protein
LSLMIFKAVLTSSCLCCNEVLRYFSNASVAAMGSSSSSEGDTPFLVRIGLFVVGDIVVIVSTDMLALQRENREAPGATFRYRMLC